MVDQPSPLVLPWFIRHNNYKESITLLNKTKSFKNTKHLFLPIFLFLLLYKARQTAKWTAIQVATMLPYHKQIDKRTTTKNQNRSAALESKVENDIYILNSCEPQVEIIEIYDIVSESRLPSQICPEIFNRKKKIKFH